MPKGIIVPEQDQSQPHGEYGKRFPKPTHETAHSGRLPGQITSAMAGHQFRDECYASGFRSSTFLYDYYWVDGTRTRSRIFVPVSRSTSAVMSRVFWASNAFHSGLTLPP